MEPDQIVSALRRHAPLALAHIVLGAIIGLAVPPGPRPRRYWRLRPGPFRTALHGGPERHSHL